MKLIVLVFIFATLFADKPELFLLKKYQKNSNISNWYMSEKLDGVRAYWDGEKLISRNGKIFSAPKFFTSQFPKMELDGELWSKRGDFSTIASIVNSKKEFSRWKNLTYNIFEVPNAKGNLFQRFTSLQESKYLKIVKQIKIKDRESLNKFLKSVESKGGEGVVLRDASLLYYTGRTKNALKMKSYIDSECKVIAYTKGKGKFETSFGALMCKLKNSSIIKIGSGFTTLERAKPPKIGAIITFKYYGLTSKGNPRFPVYLRERKR